MCLLEQRTIYCFKNWKRVKSNLIQCVTHISVFFISSEYGLTLLVSLSGCWKLVSCVTPLVIREWIDTHSGKVLIECKPFYADGIGVLIEGFSWRALRVCL